MLSERSRAMPNAVPNMTAAGRLTNQWLIWSWPLVKLKNERNIRAYRVPEMKAGQETNHGPPLICIGSRQARSPRMRPRKTVSPVNGKRRRKEAVGSFGLCCPWWLPESRSHRLPLLSTRRGAWLANQAQLVIANHKALRVDAVLTKKEPPTSGKGLQRSEVSLLPRYSEGGYRGRSPPMATSQPRRATTLGRFRTRYPHESVAEKPAEPFRLSERASAAFQCRVENRRSPLSRPIGCGSRGLPGPSDSAVDTLARALLEASGLLDVGCRRRARFEVSRFPTD